MLHKRLDGASLSRAAQFLLGHQVEKKERPVFHSYLITGIGGSGVLPFPLSRAHPYVVLRTAAGDRVSQETLTPGKNGQKGAGPWSLEGFQTEEIFGLGRRPQAHPQVAPFHLSQGSSRRRKGVGLQELGKNAYSFQEFLKGKLAVSKGILGGAAGTCAQGCWGLEGRQVGGMEE